MYDHAIQNQAVSLLQQPLIQAIFHKTNEASPVYFRLKNSIKTGSDTILIPCDVSDAEMLLSVAKHFCPGAVSKIRSVILASRTANSCGKQQHRALPIVPK